MATLSEGSRGEAVRAVQGHLLRCGLDLGTADGAWGRRTSEALLRWRAIWHRPGPPSLDEAGAKALADAAALVPPAAAVKATLPHLPASWYAYLYGSLPEAEITSPRRLAHYLAQVGHESDGGAAVRTLNGLLSLTEYADGTAYENRADLGNLSPGDGPRFRGRGAIQTTGRYNYARASAALGVDFLACPEILGCAPFAFRAAALYWREHAINADCDRDDVRGVTRRINPALRGLSDREARLKAVKAALGVP